MAADLRAPRSPLQVVVAFGSPMMLLGISMRTVQSHLDRIRAKTGRRRRAELTRLAFEIGVTPGPTEPHG